MIDPEWKAFTVDDPSWLAIEEGGAVANECLKGFHAQRIDFTGRNFGLEVSSCQDEAGLALTYSLAEYERVKGTEAFRAK